MPPQARLAPLLRDGRLSGRHWPQYEAKERLYRLLRPELVSSNDVPLSADCYSPLSYSTYKELNRLKELKTMMQDLQRATLRLCTRIVPAYARRVAVDVPAAFDGGVLSDYRLVQEMHRRGINLRFIGALIANVPEPSELPGGERAAAMARAYFLVEAVARVVKANLRQAMRVANKRPLAEYDHVAIVDILNCVFGDSEQADTYARDVLEPELARRFGVYLHDCGGGDEKRALSTLREQLEATDLPALHLLRTRIFQLTGISLAPGAPDTFDATRGSASASDRPVSTAASVFSDPYSHEKPFSDADLLFRETVKRSSGVVRAEAEALLTEAWTLMPYDQTRAEHLVRLAIRHVDEALDRMPSNAHLLADRAFAYERLLRLLSRRLRGTYGITGTFYSTDNPLVRLTEYYFQLAIEANNVNSKTLHHYARFLQHCGSFALSACYLWHAMRHAARLELLWNLAIKEYTTLALEARNNAPRNSSDTATWSRIRSDISRLCDRWRRAKQYLSLAEQTSIYAQFCEQKNQAFSSKVN
jgi:Translation initiation factor eIF3 subunit 135